MKFSTSQFTVVVIVVGIAFHLLYTYSIVDIYFKTPLVHGMPPVHSNVTAPAKRVVLFVADGLRADKFFEQQYQTPFLRTMIETKGRWGVSHTRVPTESRPGHVALLAGFYEDVSAVTTGWKDNPVDFDSVLNESYYSWSWGSPDIVPMFAKKLPHAYMDFYPPEFEDFSQDAWKLDEWVFERVHALLDKAERGEDPLLIQRLKSDGIIFFLHLLGTDTFGHAKRPYSMEYIENIRRLDREIMRLVEKIEKFFGDSSTAYIFTSDHGMSDKGSHGDGDPQNTETPLLCWGAGISKPQQKYNKDSPSLWNLNNYTRTDIAQADVAPLIASLIGRPIPLNSIGEIPLDYLAATSEEKARLLLANAKQIVLQLHRKSELMKQESLFFQQYEHMDAVESHLQQAETCIETGDAPAAIEHSTAAIRLAKLGLNYFHRYDRPFLMTVITLGYLGWIAFVVRGLLTQFGGIESKKKLGIFVSVVALGILVMIVLALDKAPILYYLYVAMPTFFWATVLSDTRALGHVYKLLSSSSSLRWSSAGILLAAIIVAEVSVLGFFWRQVFCVCFIGMSIWGWKQHGIRKNTRLAWSTLCFILSLFPLIPIDAGSFLAAVVAGGALSILWAQFLLQNSRPSIEKLFNKHFTTNISSHKATLLLGLIVLATLTVVISEWFISLGSGVPIITQVVAWITFVSSLFTVMLSGRDEHDIMLTVFSGLSVAYIILSISFESIFFTLLSVILSMWLVVEKRLQESEVQSKKLQGGLSMRSVRIATFYLLFCFMAFFGTGNIASIGSFEISSTYRLVTVFSPFLMAALLFIKVLIPFVLLCTVYGLMNRLLNISPLIGFIMVALLTDVMAISFFFLVTDEGSWRDIGMSISRFAMCNGFLVFQLLMAALSSWLLRRLDKPHSQ